jgi:hypothetical protein
MYMRVLFSMHAIRVLAYYTYMYGNESVWRLSVVPCPGYHYNYNKEINMGNSFVVKLELVRCTIGSIDTGS